AMVTAPNRFKKLVYNYDLVSGKVNTVAYQPGAPDAFYHRYTYDAENRLTNVETSTDEVYWENEAYYQYYKHGPLAKTIVGQQQVQGLDYAYTLQGWLKSVNSSILSPVYDMGHDGVKGSPVASDAFGFALHYSGDRDYKSIGNTNAIAGGTTSNAALFSPLYNGNIAAMSVNIATLGQPLLYTYKYDVLNRLSSMTAANGLNTTTNTWTPNKLDDFEEAITYDANGNIQSYHRNGNKTFAGKPLAMDELTYSYNLNNNQLDYISDVVPDGNYPNDIDAQAVHNYTYDKIGNLTADLKSGIDTIVWTVYGKIQRIHKLDGTVITYAYDVAGNRINKKVKDVETWYVRDATGNVMGVYTKGDPAVNQGQLTLIESDLYGSSRLGLLNRQVNVQNSVAPVSRDLPALGTGINTIFTRGNKVFELSNHLGNVLATVSDRKRPITIDGTTIDHFDPLLTSVQDYYPFGSLMPGRSGHAIQNGWVSGTNAVNGYTLPVDLSVNNRADNQPAEYVASNSVEFQVGFVSSAADNFSAYIADASYAGGGSGSGTSTTGTGGYRYGFNGKENDNEVKGEGNQQDYGMRIYDPRLGRFLSVDPLSPKYPWYTPYQFAGNNPIKFIDMDGLEPASVSIDGNQIVYSGGLIISTADIYRITYLNAVLGMKLPTNITPANPYDDGDPYNRDTWEKAYQNTTYFFSHQVPAYSKSTAATKVAHMAVVKGLLSGNDKEANSAIEQIDQSEGFWYSNSIAELVVYNTSFRSEIAKMLLPRPGLLEGKIDPLVRSTVQAIESAMPKSVRAIEQEIINPITRKSVTDFDIILDKFIIEVDKGTAKGKLAQVGRIQSVTKKEVVVFAPNMGGALE
ncbi:RHS repeat-associated core domain-containing protein, partial [Chitinophaga sp.]|uniref:RHS repeat protein n=1 Tax=Chitinophaga sp. TaxID=1869181 RepID=UPI002F93A312